MPVDQWLLPVRNGVAAAAVATTSVLFFVNRLLFYDVPRSLACQIADTCKPDGLERAPLYAAGALPAASVVAVIALLFVPHHNRLRLLRFVIFVVALGMTITALFVVSHALAFQRGRSNAWGR